MSRTKRWTPLNVGMSCVEGISRPPSCCVNPRIEQEDRMSVKRAAPRYCMDVTSTEQTQRRERSRYNRFMDRLEAWIAPVSEEEEALEEVILASENQRLALVGIGVAVVGMTAALVIA